MKLIKEDYVPIYPARSTPGAFAEEQNSAKSKFDNELLETVGQNILFRSKRSDVPFRKAKVVHISNDMIELKVSKGNGNEIYPLFDIQLAWP